jgi:hypothetical protein
MSRSRPFRRSRRCNSLADSLSERGAPVVWFIPNAYPHGCAVARALHPSCLTIDAAAIQALPQCRTQKDVVETQTAIAFPALPLVIPEGSRRSSFNGAERMRLR